MSNHDFRDQEPAWVRYAEYVGGGHDKFYEVRVDLADDGSFIITRRWGARPDTGVGQIKTEARHSMTQAVGTALTYFGAKIHKGYRECERPMAASRLVAQDWED
jgi:predicted DNA-binding WGR domain protein